MISSNFPWTINLNFQTRKSGFARDPIVDDQADFQRLAKALAGSGFTAEQQNFIWSTVAGILHLGNITFEEQVNDTKGKRNSESRYLRG